MLAELAIRVDGPLPGLDQHLQREVAALLLEVGFAVAMWKLALLELVLARFVK